MVDPKWLTVGLDTVVESSPADGLQLNDNDPVPPLPVGVLPIVTIELVHAVKL